MRKCAKVLLDVGVVVFLSIFIERGRERERNESNWAIEDKVLKFHINVYCSTSSHATIRFTQKKKNWRMKKSCRSAGCLLFSQLLKGPKDKDP